MNLDTNNYRKFTLLILILVSASFFVSWALYIALNAYFESLPTSIKVIISIPTAPAIYAFLFWIFDNYLWRHSFFKKIGIVIAEDLNGEWQGVVKSSYDEFQSDIQAKLIIDQTATKIKVRGVFNESASISIHENFGRSEIDGRIALYYFFRNEPKYDAVPTMAIHEGSVKLVYDPKKDALAGYYYSGRDRNNHGTIEVERI